MNSKTALAHVSDSRDDFYSYRKEIVKEEIEKISWLRDSFNIIESDILRSKDNVIDFLEKISKEGVNSLVIHIPTWADPILGLTLASLARIPTIVIGNSRTDSSSMVGILGLGGSLDQIGIRHERVFNIHNEEGIKKVNAFVNATNCIAKLRGRTLGLFGGKSLGIFTAVADAAQWQALFGVEIQHIDQYEIVLKSEEIPNNLVDDYLSWLKKNLKNITYGGSFNEEKLRLQIKSYLATKELIKNHHLDFIGVKCQPEMSDGFVSQCLSHSLCNSSFDADGEKEPIIHACESDADGALSMEILKIISGGKPSALLDIRFFDSNNNLWTLANCGAIALDFFKTEKTQSKIENVEITPHVFGEGGGGAIPGIVAPQNLTLARLCRIDREYIMHILRGKAVIGKDFDLSNTTSAFPQAFVRTDTGPDFLDEYGSNHIHMVNGDYVEDLKFLCDLLGIKSKVWLKKVRSYGTKS